MKERPILMSAPMVRAILEGRKTQTRRIIKIPGIMPRTSFAITSQDEEIIRFDDGTFHYLSTAALSGPYPCPYGQPGDRLWVRETFAVPSDVPENTRYVAYRSDSCEENFRLRWKPSIHMPRWASRITLEIVGVRVERLQDISEEDAAAEGIHFDRSVPFNGPWFIEPGDPQGYLLASSCYEALLEKINGAGSWAENPWVWVIEFRRIMCDAASSP